MKELSRREGDIIMAEMQKTVEDVQHLMAEFVHTSNETQKSVLVMKELLTALNTVIMGDGVQPGIYRDVKKLKEQQEEYEKLDVVVVTRKSKKFFDRIDAYTYLLAFFGITSLPTFFLSMKGVVLFILSIIERVAAG